MGNLLKRSALKRKTPMKRSSLNSRYTPITSKRAIPRARAEKEAWTSGGRTPGIDPKYRAWIRLLPCIICLKNWLFSESAEAIVEAAMMGQNEVSECAHIGSRGLGQKCSDRQSCALCPDHHRTGAEARHVLGRNFWTFHKMDRDAVIRRLQELHKSAQKS